MKILLDATYFLPVVGISIVELPVGVPAKLTKNGHQVAISEITLFELAAKSAKLAALGKLPQERVTAGMKALLYDETIEKLPFETPIFSTAFSLRSLLNDFIDCMILSTALNHCDALLTEDADIHAQKKNKPYQDLVSTINPHFELLKIGEFQ